MLLQSPEVRASRLVLFDEAGTRDVRQMLTTTKGICAAARWVVQRLVHVIWPRDRTAESFQIAHEGKENLQA